MPRPREVAQLHTAGTCMTARGVAFLNTLSDLSINFIAEQQYSAPFPTHRMLLGAASSKFAHSFACAGGSSALHFPEQFFVPPSACCMRTAFAPREGQGARARARGRAGLSALVPLPVFLSLLVFNFQARRSCRARFSELSEPKGWFGCADPHCQGEPSSQHVQQLGVAAAQGPRRC